MPQVEGLGKADLQMDVGKQNAPAIRHLPNRSYLEIRKREEARACCIYRGPLTFYIKERTKRAAVEVQARNAKLTLIGEGGAEMWVGSIRNRLLNRLCACKTLRNGMARKVPFKVCFLSSFSTCA